MNYQPEISLEEVINRVIELIGEEQNDVYIKGGKLKDIYMQVVEGTYKNKTYEEITEGTNYSHDYIKEKGQDLWEMISKKLGEKEVKKKNFVAVMVDYKNKQASSENGSNPLKASQSEARRMLEETVNNLEFSEEGVPLNSHFYIERHNVESLCYKTIKQPGALIRIKSPQKMGKTLLLVNLLGYARQQGYKTAKLDLKLTDDNTLTDLKTFLQWLCVEVSDSLELQSRVEEYWQDIIGVKTSCHNYFQRYLLQSDHLKSPLVLAIDNCELLFKSPVFSEFFPLLRAWHENAKQGGRVGSIWSKLRLVLVYSTETYPELDTNHSPFNVGIPIELPDFNLSEVTTFAKKYQLDEQLGENGLRQLMGLVGGHPSFIQEAFTNLKNQQTTLDQLLKLAPKEQGIYRNHLRQQLWILQHNHELKSAYREVVMANEPVRLDTEVAFKLHSIGLVKFSGNDCIPSYKLYRQYYSEHLE